MKIKSLKVCPLLMMFLFSFLGVAEEEMLKSDNGACANYELSKVFPAFRLKPGKSLKLVKNLETTFRGYALSAKYPSDWYGRISESGLNISPSVKGDCIIFAPKLKKGELPDADRENEECSQIEVSIVNDFEVVSSRDKKAAAGVAEFVAYHSPYAITKKWTDLAVIKNEIQGEQHSHTVSSWNGCSTSQIGYFEITKNLWLQILFSFQSSKIKKDSVQKRNSFQTFIEVINSIQVKKVSSK